MIHTVEARGYSANGKLRIACAFDQVLFDKILAEAKKSKKPFSEMAAELCKVGMLCLEESDALEPKSPEPIKT